MKLYSNGRSEIIEQAGRKSFHMGFDIDIESFGISMEADLSLPTKSTRKISMMTSFNEELYNASAEFISKVKLYDSDMREFNDDMLVTLVTKMIHNTIQRLNAKGEPMRNIFVKTPKAKARELELTKEEYLGKPEVKIVKPVIESIIDEDIIDDIKEDAIVEEKVIVPVKKPVSKTKGKIAKTISQTKSKGVIKIPQSKESPFSSKKEF